MIRFDYTIVRDEGDEKRTYTPTIPQELDDLVCIEGPNSSGKSTLLHILALGLFGLKNKNIKNSLQRKLKDLAGSDHQEVTFSVSLSNESSGLEIVSEKKRPRSDELTIYEILNGKRSLLTPESFEKKYSLIYDIPEDPLERLDELTRELRDRQVMVGRSIGELKLWLRDTIKEVQGSADPKKLDEFRRHHQELAAKLASLDAEEQNLKNDRQLLKRYYASKFYRFYLDELAEGTERLRELEEKRKSLEKQGKNIKKRIGSLKKDGTAAFTAIETSMKELTFTFKVMNIRTKEDFLSVWGSLDLRDTFLSPDRHSILFDGIKAFRSKVKELDGGLGSDGKLDEATLLADLLQLLDRYIGMKTLLPGTDKTIPQFVEALDKRYKECRQIKAQHDRYLEILHRLETLEVNCHQFVDVYVPELEAVLQEQNQTDGGQEEAIENDILKMSDSLDDIRKRIDFFREELIRSGCKEQDAESIVAAFVSRKELKPYAGYTEKELEEKLSDLQEELNSLSKTRKETEYYLARDEHEIHRLEQQKPHKYQHRLDDLQTIFSEVQLLEQTLLKEYDDNLKLLMSKSIKRSTLTKAQVEYFDAVATYLGKKVGTIRHVDKEHSVDKIDLVDRRVITATGKKILLTDLGTGQSQSAYLKGLLSSQDKRKVIALIDEVAMMDSKSMKPIFELLKKKYKDGRLLAGVVVQKGESLTVSPMP